MSGKVIILCVVVFAYLVKPVQSSESLGYKSDQILVRFAPKTNGKHLIRAEQETILAPLGGGSVKHSYKIVPGLTVVKLPQGKTVKDALATFSKSKDILYAEPDYEFKLFSTFPNDTRFNELWGMNNTGQTGGTPDADIDAPEAWDITTDSNIIVAVIDTGVDYTHPDLCANMWKNPGEIPDNGIDDDGNGFIDDVYGWDFYSDVNNPKDYYGHGTRIAGIIGAVGNNGIGVTGVCWNVKIMAINITHYGTEAPGIFISHAIMGIDYAVYNGANIINASWGITYNVQSMKNAIEAADANGVLIVAAAGNDYGNNNDMSPRYPSSYDSNNIISVLSTDQYDAMSDFSNYGPSSVDLGAPGSNILSCYLYHDYTYDDGTSYAAPHVAGACALVWSMNLKLSHLQVKDIILNSVDHLTSLSDKCVTGGRLNLYNAVSNTPPPGPSLTKVDDVPDGHYVIEGDYVTYTIFYDFNYPGQTSDIPNAILVDQLPQQIDPFDVNPSDGGVYDMNYNTVTWELGTLSPGDSNCFTLTVRFGELNENWGTATNVCRIKSGSTVYATATENTQLGPWGRIRNINNGIWYDFIQDAIDDANDEDVIQVWPGTYEEDLEIFDKSITLRSTDPTNQNVVASTIIYGSGYGLNEEAPVITFDNATGSIVTGFTITNGTESVWCKYSSVEISNCIIENNSGIGILIHYCLNPIITNCIIRNNQWMGIHCWGGWDTEESSYPIISNSIIENGYSGISIYYCDPIISNCVIKDNRTYGIYIDSNDASSIIKNNFLFNNDMVFHNGGGAQIYLLSKEDTIIRNNTIISKEGGIVVSEEGIYPTISNCIIWCPNTLCTINDDYGDRHPITDCDVTYSCIQGGYAGIGNISTNPSFFNADANNFHITSDSLCKNRGDPNVNYDDETDIDGEPRVIYGRVDIGADEYYLCLSDFDDSNSVDFKDYAILAKAWKSSPPDVNYNEKCDLKDDNKINCSDLELFCYDWLWQAGWEAGWMFSSQGGQQMMSLNVLTVLSVSAEASDQLQDQEEDSQQPEANLTMSDVKKTLEWVDSIQLESEGSLSYADYQKFRKALEEDLLSKLQPDEK